MAGAFAGLCEVLVMYPLDVVKTRFQLQTKGSAVQYTGIVDCFRQMIRQEGFWSLYRGIISPILAEAPKRALKFSANEQYKVLFGNMPLEYRMFMSGAAAGMTEAFINCPFEVVKVRMQAKENVGIYKNTRHATMSTIRNEGVFALYKGFEAQLWRNGVWNGTYFGVIHKIKAAMPKPTNKKEELGVNFVAGFIAGTAATTLNTPLDVVKSRKQNPAHAVHYKWALPSVAKIYREEGFRALFKGYTPRVIRLGPGGGIMLVAFDWFSTILDKLF